MKVLKIFTDFEEDIAELSDAEAGRLMRAMLRYARTGEEPILSGSERVLWKTSKRNIDKQQEAYMRICEQNRKNVTKRYEPLRTVANRNESYQDKDKDKDNTPLSPYGDMPPFGAVTPPARTYGKFANVVLTDEELAKLKERFSADWSRRIERLSQYLKANPKKRYDSHYATMLMWAEADAKKAAERAEESRGAAASKPNRQRDFGYGRTYSESDLNAVGTELLENG